MFFRMLAALAVVGLATQSAAAEDPHLNRCAQSETFRTRSFHQPLIGKSESDDEEENTVDYAKREADANRSSLVQGLLKQVCEQDQSRLSNFHAEGSSVGSCTSDARFQRDERGRPIVVVNVSCSLRVADAAGAVSRETGAAANAVLDYVQYDADFGDLQLRSVGKGLRSPPK